MTCPYKYPVVFGGCPYDCPYCDSCPDFDGKTGKLYDINQVNNSRRLASALYAASGDPVAVKRIAMALHYDVAQLQRDMIDIDAVTWAFARCTDAIGGGDD